MLFGNLKVKIYDFEISGDILPMHVHDEDTSHITIVSRGKIKAYGESWERILESGQVIDFTSGMMHEIVSLEDNTRIVNVLKK